MDIPRCSSPEGDQMDIDSLGSQPLRRSRRQTKEPERYGRTPTSTLNVSFKRSADGERENPDSRKKAKLNTGEGQLQTSIPQYKSRGQPGSRGGNKSQSIGFSDGPGRAQTASSWRRNDSQDDSNNDRPGPSARDSPWPRSTTGIGRNHQVGTIVHARHFSKRVRNPTPNEREYIVRISDGTNDEVYCKPRFHIILKNQMHHYITVPLYSKKNGFIPPDGPYLGEWLKVVRSGQATTGANPTTHSEVLKARNFDNYWDDKFLENGQPSYAHYLEPNSLDKHWKPLRVAELEQGSFDTLMTLFAQKFIVARPAGQA